MLFRNPMCFTASVHRAAALKATTHSFLKSSIGCRGGLPAGLSSSTGENRRQAVCGENAAEQKQRNSCKRVHRFTLFCKWRRGRHA